MILEVLGGMLAAIAIGIAFAVLWLPVIKFITGGPRQDAFAWSWDFKKYIVFWVKMICWTVVIIPLVFFSLFSLLKGEVSAAALFIFLSIIFYNIQKVVRSI